MINTITQVLPTGSFSTSGIKTEPDISTRVSGMAENQGLPYEYWNYYLNMFTSNTNTIDTAVNAVITELDNVLAAASITVNPAVHNQVALAVQYLIDHTTNTVRGATYVVSSSDSQTTSQNGSHSIISTSSNAGAALNALIVTLNAAGGGNILLMEGTYNFTTNLLPLSNVNIYGCGISTVLKRGSASLTQVIYIPNTVSNVTFKDFYIDGNGAVYTVSGTTYGIRCQDNTNLGVSYYNIINNNHKGSNVFAFNDCTNMFNCQSNSNTATLTTCFGFIECLNLYNCTSNGNTSPLGEVAGFTWCNYLFHCTSNSNTNTGAFPTYGYDTCSRLSYCVASSNTSTGDVGIGYIGCNYMHQNAGLSNKTSLLNSCYADYNSVAAAFTSSGGYNG
jgi:hypothetical protein